MPGTAVAILIAAITAASPLIAAALGGMFSEKSGVINIGLEGIMTISAFSTAITIYLVEINFNTTGQFVIYIGLIVGILSGTVFALLHAYLSISLKIDQIISGTAINIIGLGLALFLTNVIFNSATTPMFSSIDSKIFGISEIVYVTLLLVPVCSYVMYKTAWGIHLRACGENPIAAGSMGLNVKKLQYQGVILSGVFAALGGSIIVLTAVSNFSGSVVAGKGFIALAVLIFGRWNPKGILLAGLMFGFFTSLAITISVIYPTLKIDGIYFELLPYILTIVALVLFSRNNVAPKALGK